jgi:hypothetical protein
MPRLLAASLLSAAITAFGLASGGKAAEPVLGGKPIPAMQALPLPYDQASVERRGQEIARYHFGPSLRRPFLYPLVANANGKSLTRMGHPRDPHGHSHHNSLWISHHDVNGVSFWGDSGKGKIATKRIVRYEDTDDEALIQAQHAWIDESSGKTLLEELRTLRFQKLETTDWRLVIDLEFTAKEPVTFGKTPFGLVGVRMAKTIGVHDGGGRIINSAGAVNEKEVFWKPAKWVDYSGPIAPDGRGGIALFDHPSNPNHPTVFHVRDDGWMGASLTFAEPRTIEPDAPLTLRYGFWIHAGQRELAAIETQFEAFAKVGDPAPPAKK